MIRLKKGSKSKFLLLTSILSISCFLLAIYFPNIANNSFNAIDETCVHDGYHYSQKEASYGQHGYKEFWSCCKCHNAYLSEPNQGHFEDKSELVSTTIEELAQTHPSFILHHHSDNIGGCDVINCNEGVMTSDEVDYSKNMYGACWNYSDAISPYVENEYCTLLDGNALVYDINTTLSLDEETDRQLILPRIDYSKYCYVEFQYTDSATWSGIGFDNSLPTDTGNRMSGVINISLVDGVLKCVRTITSGDHKGEVTYKNYIDENIIYGRSGLPLIGHVKAYFRFHFSIPTLHIEHSYSSNILPSTSSIGPVGNRCSICHKMIVKSGKANNDSIDLENNMYGARRYFGGTWEATSLDWSESESLDNITLSGSNSITYRVINWNYFRLDLPIIKYAFYEHVQFDIELSTSCTSGNNFVSLSSALSSNMYDLGANNFNGITGVGKISHNLNSYTFELKLGSICISRDLSSNEINGLCSIPIYLHTRINGVGYVNFSNFSLCDESSIHSIVHTINDHEHIGASYYDYCDLCEKYINHGEVDTAVDFSTYMYGTGEEKNNIRYIDKLVTSDDYNGGLVFEGPINTVDKVNGYFSMPKVNYTLYNTVLYQWKNFNYACQISLDNINFTSWSFSTNYNGLIVINYDSSLRQIIVTLKQGATVVGSPLVINDEDILTGKKGFKLYTGTFAYRAIYISKPTLSLASTGISLVDGTNTSIEEIL